MFIYVMLHEAVLHKCMKLIPLSPLNQTPQPISGTCFFFLKIGCNFMVYASKMITTLYYNTKQ